MQQGLLWHDGKFSAMRTGLRVKGQPTLNEWSSAIRTSLAVKDGIQWAIGDLLIYADGRQWDDAEVESILDKTGLKRATFNNHKSVAKKWPQERRTNAPWSHHALLASLEPDAADAMLVESAEHAWGYEELQVHVRAKRQALRKAALPFPTGTFGVMLADPTWKRGIGDADGFTPAALQAMAGEVQKIAAPTCVLYLVVPASLIKAGVMTLESWGFDLKASHALVAQSTARETAWTREQHELVLVGARGPDAAPIEQHVPPSVFYASTLDDHGIIMVNIEVSYPDVAKVRLFSGEDREGWTTWGHVMVPADAPERGILVREPAAVA